jgi:hypothetical protein
VAEDFVALASDRRITWQIGGATTGWEDTENKAVVLAGHFLLGYTGFARLGGVETERWIVEKLVHSDPSSYFTVLANEAEAAVNALGLPLECSGHAFVGVGYGASRKDQAGVLHPAGVHVSNALGDGEYGTWAPTRVFDTRKTPPLRAADDFGLNAFGLSPARPVVDGVVDLIRRYRKRHPGRVIGIVQLMVDLIRRVAADCDGVSADVSVSVLPRVAVPAGGVQLTSPGGLLTDPVETLTCIFVPADRTAEQADVYAPAMVEPGMSMFGGEIWSKKPPWWK